MNTNMTWFDGFQNKLPLVLWMKVAAISIGKAKYLLPASNLNTGPPAPCSEPIFNPYNAEAAFVLRTRTQRFL